MLIAWSVKYIAVYDDTPALYLTPELKCFIYNRTSQKWWTPQGYVFSHHLNELLYLLTQCLVVPDVGEIICNKLTVSQLHFFPYHFLWHHTYVIIGSNVCILTAVCLWVMSLYYVLEHSLLLCVLYTKSCWRTALLENDKRYHHRSRSSYT